MHMTAKLTKKNSTILIKIMNFSTGIYMSKSFQINSKIVPKLRRYSNFYLCDVASNLTELDAHK